MEIIRDILYKNVKVFIRYRTTEDILFKINLKRFRNNKLLNVKAHSKTKLKLNGLEMRVEIKRRHAETQNFSALCRRSNGGEEAGEEINAEG